MYTHQITKPTVQAQISLLGDLKTETEDREENNTCITSEYSSCWPIPTNHMVYFSWQFPYFLSSEKCHYYGDFGYLWVLLDRNLYF